MTEPVVASALALWSFEGAAATFVAGRENRVFRVHTDQGDFALRLKRPGYRSRAEQLSELHWLAAMDRAGLSVPQPVASLSGALLETVAGQDADLVGWLPGQPLGRTGAPLSQPDAPVIFHRLGAEIARLHNACDDWAPPEGFARHHWNTEGLVGNAPLWGRFWDNPTLDAPTRQLLMRFRDLARAELDRLVDTLDYGLIHADLVRENVLIDGATIRLIDFDDGGFGYRLFDIATALIKNLAEPGFEGLKAALLAGYRRHRPLDDRPLELFMALRAATYVGWIVPRMEDEGAHARNARFLSQARKLCARYLDQPLLN